MDAKMVIPFLKDYFKRLKLLNRPKIFGHIKSMDKQHFSDVIKTDERSQSKIITKSKLLLVSFLIITLTILFLTNSFFSSRFSDIIKRQGQINLTKNASDVLSELQKNSIIFSTSSQRPRNNESVNFERFFSLIRQVFTFYR